MRSKISNVLWGVFLILLGVIIAGKSFELWDFNFFFRGWWTLFIIIPSVIGLIQHGFNATSIAGIIIGLLLLSSSQGYIDSITIGKLILPLILVLIGCNLLFRNIIFKSVYLRSSTFNHQDSTAEYTQIFTRKKVTLSNDVFYGGTINSIFGGLELDLRNALIQEDIVLDCTSIFGGVTVFVPNNTKVKASCVPIFGGLSNKSATTTMKDSPSIFINATCIFGGVDIR